MNTSSKDTHHPPPNGKLIQICASQNDLFAIDTEGIVYQYDFKARMWERLAERHAFNALSQTDRDPGALR